MVGELEFFRQLISFARNYGDTTIIPEVINNFSTRIQKITLPETTIAPKNDGFQ